MTTREQMPIEDVNDAVSTASRLAFGAAKRANLPEGERNHTVGTAIAETVARIASTNKVDIPSRNVAEGSEQGTVEQGQSRARS